MVTEIVVKSGSASKVIMKQARNFDADLIVMGNCAQLKLTHGLLGSTARHVTHEAKIPVLLIPNCT
jgi:nucleotide-binding universal stress UspA family protein